MTSITLTAPAKVNLFLKVLNRRPDGYHNIVTLFERVSLADKVAISKIPQGIIVSSDKFITRNPKDNIIYRAAELILKHNGADKGRIGGERGRIGENKGMIGGDKGVMIRVRKRIPIAAGLGGGSSDAAATLIGINKLCRLGLTDKELMALGRKIGADVGFFITGMPFAIGQGTGDILRKCHIRLKLYHLIIYPGFKVATRGIYQEYDRRTRGLTSAIPDDKISRLLNNSRNLNSVESMLRNNLEDVVIAKKPVIGRIIERLAHTLDKKAVVSGSGPSVFCLYSTRKEAMAARKRLSDEMTAGEKKRWQVFIAETLV